MEQATTRVKLTLVGDRGIRIERDFDAPREVVWRAFTEPELTAQWWGRGNTLEVLRDEARPGGHWRYVEHAPDGVAGFEGRYREVQRPERIERTFEWDGAPGHVSVEDTRFEDAGGRTRLVATTTFFDQADRDAMLGAGMEDGMNDSYRALDRLLASLG